MLFLNLGETDAKGFLLLQGDVEILSGYQQSLQILSAGANGLWFGDEQLFCSTEREISAKAHSPCIIAIFNRKHFKVLFYHLYLYCVVVILPIILYMLAYYIMLYFITMYYVISYCIIILFCKELCIMVIKGYPL